MEVFMKAKNKLSKQTIKPTNKEIRCAIRKILDNFEIPKIKIFFMVTEDPWLLTIFIAGIKAILFEKMKIDVGPIKDKKNFLRLSKLIIGTYRESRRVNRKSI